MFALHDFFAADALAQVQNGQIIGIIPDPSGAVVAHASVHVRNLGTGYEAHFESNDARNLRGSGIDRRFLHHPRRSPRFQDSHCHESSL